MGHKKNLVVKSNQLVEASYRLTLAEQRLILFAIVEARRTQSGLSADKFATIRATDYAAMYGVQLNKAYEQIKEASETLFQRYVVFHDTHPESGKPRKSKVRWLSTASYIDGAGTIQIRFATDMVAHITQLEREFTRYSLQVIANMTSAYAIRLYELLMQWGSVGERQIELAWLKKTLMLEKDYPRLFDFKRRVLDVAVSQINEHSDLTVSYTQRKSGRLVTHLIFIFAPKDAPLTERPADPESNSPTTDKPRGIRDTDLFQRLRRHGIGERLALSWIRQNPPRAQAALDYTEQRAAQGLIKGSVAGYLRKLVESDTDIGPSAFERECKKTPPTNSRRLPRTEIERLAKPGESWEQAEERIRRERDGERPLRQEARVL